MCSTEKKCYQCGLVLPRDSFDKNKSRKSGLSDQCKKCRSESSKKYWLNNPRIKLTSLEKSQKSRESRNQKKIMESFYLNMIKSLNHTTKRNFWLTLSREALTDNYIIGLLKTAGLTQNTIMENPALIILKRLELKTNRVIKIKSIKQQNNDHKN